MINIIILVKDLQKISDGLYIRVYTFNKIYYSNDRYNRYQISNRYQLNGEMHVNYPSLLNLVQSVITINAKYVD